MRRTRHFDRFTHSQLHALDTRRNLAVRANAGSGKTSVLVERIVQLLARGWDEKQHLELKHIVAITFTRKAAAELQDRLRKSFQEMAGASGDAREQAFWVACIDELPRAVIGTIDSFCARLLRHFGGEDSSPLRIEPDFQPLEGYEEAVLKREAVDRLINRLSSLAEERASAPERAQAEACRWLGMYQGYEALAQHLTALLDHLVDPEIIASAHRDQPAARERVQAARLQLPAYRRLNQDRARLVAELGALRDHLLILKKPNQKLTSLCESLESIIGLLFQKTQQADEQGLLALQGALLTGDGDPRRQGLDSIKAVVGPIQDTWVPLLRGLEFDDAGELRALEAADRLVLLLEPAHDEYMYLCRQTNRFDFLTLARRTRNLLARHPEICAELKHTYRYFLVDEFQDTNYLQWEIIARLVGAGPEGPLDRDRLFVVGDPQQSIYRFRHADVSVFGRVAELIRQANEQHGLANQPTDYERFHKDSLHAELRADSEQRLGQMLLPENHRSLAPLPLLLMDRVFHYAFDPAIHGLDLAQHTFEVRYENLKPGRRFSECGEVRFVIPADQTGADDRSAGSPEEPRAETDLGVLQIRCVVDQLVAVHGQPKRTAENGQRATLSWGDMAILLPSRSVVLTGLEKELQSRGVPFVVTRGIGFWQRQEIRDVINLATWLVDAGDELALFAVLRGPVGQLADTAIVFLAQLGLGSVSRGLQFLAAVDDDLNVAPALARSVRNHVTQRWRRLPALEQEALRGIWQEFSPPTREHIRRLIARLETWQARVDRMAHADLLQRALEESGAYAIYAAETGAERILANLARLFDTIRGEEFATGPGLARLARRLRSQMDESYREEQASLAVGEDAVQIMTVHAAKGLEFPVVAVMKMDRRATWSRSFSLMVKNPRDLLLQEDAESLPEIRPGTVAVRVRHPQRPRETYTPRLLRALQRLDQAQQLAESRRLFYVAATRAKERLILAGKQPRPKKDGTSAELPESWQRWFEKALDLTEEHKSSGLWEDPDQGFKVAIITTATESRTPEAVRPEEPAVQLALRYVRERPRYTALATTGLQTMLDCWQGNPVHWWLAYRVHVRPAIEPLSNGSTRPTESVGMIVGTLVHRIFECRAALAKRSRSERLALLEGMAANLLTAAAPEDGPGEGFTPVSRQIREVAEDVDAIWQRIHDSGSQGQAIYDLLQADGDPEVPFALRLGRWHISGRYDKLLRTAGAFEIVDWKTDRQADPEKIVEHYTTQMKLYALALHLAGQAAETDGMVRVHLALLHHLQVRPMLFSIAELSAYADRLTGELERMDRFEPQ